MLFLVDFIDNDSGSDVGVVISKDHSAVSVALWIGCIATTVIQI